MDGYLLDRGCHLCSGNAAVSRAGLAWRGVERTSRSARGLGNERVFAKRDVATWVGGKSGVFAAEISPVSSARFDHGAVGDELCVAAVSCRDCDWAAHEAALTEARATGCRRRRWSGRGCAGVWFGAAGTTAETDADDKGGADYLRREGE